MRKVFRWAVLVPVVIVVTAPAHAGTKMTTDELAKIRDQLRSCWILPSGAENSAVTVDIAAQFNSDRTLKAETLLDTDDHYNKDTDYHAIADSAMLALRVKGCNPLGLPPDKYDEWKSITFRFNPKEMGKPDPKETGKSAPKEINPHDALF